MMNESRLSKATSVKGAMASMTTNTKEQGRIFKIVSYQIGPRYFRRFARLLGYTTFQLNEFDRIAFQKHFRLNETCEYMLNEWMATKADDFDWKTEIKTALETLGRQDILQNIDTDQLKIFELVKNNLDPEQVRRFGRYLGLTTYDLDILETHFLQYEIPRHEWCQFILNEWIERKSPASDWKREITEALKNMCENKLMKSPLPDLCDDESLPSFSEYREHFEIVSANVEDMSLTSLAKHLGLEKSWLDDLLKYWHSRGYTRREMCFNLLEEWLWKGRNTDTDAFYWKKVLAETLTKLNRNDLVEKICPSEADQKPDEG